MSRADEIKEKARRIRAGRPDASGVAQLRIGVAEEISNSSPPEISTSSAKDVRTSGAVGPDGSCAVPTGVPEKEVRTDGATEDSGSVPQEPRTSVPEEPRTSEAEDERGSGATKVSTSVPPPILKPAAPRVRTVRLSVDIAPAEHRELIALGAALADEIGAVRVHNQEMMHALLRLLLSDTTLVDRVRADIHRRRG